MHVVFQVDVVMRIVCRCLYILIQIIMMMVAIVCNVLVCSNNLGASSREHSTN